MTRQTTVNQKLEMLQRIGWTKHPRKMAMVSPDETVLLAISHLVTWNEDEWGRWCKLNGPQQGDNDA